VLYIAKERVIVKVVKMYHSQSERMGEDERIRIAGRRRVI
jgi:hypothetical protein